MSTYACHKSVTNLFLADECCEDRKLLLDIFREIELEAGVRLYDGADGENADGPILPKLSFPSGKLGRHVWDMRDASVISLAVADLSGGRDGQDIVLGMDCEWEPSLGGMPPNPVSTVQLSLPSGTAYCFQLQYGNEKTTKSDFPEALRHLLESPSIKKVRINITFG